MQHIKAAIKAHAELELHWKLLLPNLDSAEVSYERLVENFESSVQEVSFHPPPSLTDAKSYEHGPA